MNGRFVARAVGCAHRKGRDVGDGLARAPAGGARAFESVGSRRRAPLSAPAADRSRRARRDRPFRCCCESPALPSPRLCPHHPTGPARRRDVRARGRRARADDTRARASPGGDSHPAKLTPLDAARKWAGDATASEVVAFFFRGPEREERDAARYRRSVTPEFKETVAPTTPQFPPFVAIGIFIFVPGTFPSRLLSCILSREARSQRGA